MNRYRVIYSTDPSGAFTEFSAVDDAAALVHARRYPWKGRVVALEEVTGPHSVRPLQSTTNQQGCES